MMKLFQKKKNNKGFSLVELIVVVAIMAVLMGILIPTLITNVEKTKHQKDISGLSEILNAMNIEMADETYSGMTGKIVYTGGSFSIATTGSGTDAAVPTNTKSKTLATFLSAVAKDLNGEDATDYTFTYSSKMNADNTTVTFTFANGKVTGSVTSTKYSTEDLQ